MGDTDGSFDLTTTVVSADGRLTKETWSADPRAEIDCFYLYSAVSRDTTTRSDMIAGDEERNVIRQQCARFASVCRPYAPLYRQVTLKGRAPAVGRGRRCSAPLARRELFRRGSGVDALPRA